MLYLTLRQYEYIVAIAQEQSLTRAAAALNVSQPSLSVAIDRVETRLGDRIFLRGKGASITVTPQGHRFIDQARDLISKAHLVEMSLTTARPTVVGCFEDIAPWYLPKALSGLKQVFEGREFQGYEGRFSTLANDLLEGRLDFAISYDIGFDSAFERVRLNRVSPVAFLSPSHPLADRSSLGIRDLKDLPLVLSTEALSKSYIAELFRQFTLTPVIAHTTTSLEMMRALAAHGEGIGISYSNPPSGISYDGQPIVTIPISNSEAMADIMLIWSAHRSRNIDISKLVHVLCDLW